MGSVVSADERESLAPRAVWFVFMSVSGVETPPQESAEIM
jgi:hypothetical protein